MSSTGCLRVKTVWFRKEGAPRAPAELATVMASTVWRLADRAVDSLSREGYGILTPARGFRMISEFVAFGVHYCDRLAFGVTTAESRAAFIRALGQRLAEVMEQNLRSAVGEDGRDYRAEFIDMLNRRAADYATFEFPEEGASFPALRYLAAQVREVMEGHDQPWVMASVMEIVAPEILGTVRKAMDGLFAPGISPTPQRTPISGPD